MAWPKGVPRSAMKNGTTYPPPLFATPTVKRKPGRPKKNTVMPPAGGNGGGQFYANGDPAKDPVALQLLALYTVQNLGQGSLEEIHEMMTKKLQVAVHKNVLENALDALRRRDFVSLTYGKGEDGHRHDIFGIRNLKFQAAPEVAHYGNVLPELVSSPIAEAIKKGLDAKELKTKSKVKANRLGYRDYFMVKATFVTTEPLLGGTPRSPYIDRMLKLTGNKVEADVYFDRDALGNPIIAGDQVNGWVRSNIRIASKSDATAYIGSTPAKFINVKPSDTIQFALPIVDQRGGKGLVRYETIMAGAKFEITFTVPSFGFMTPEAFRPHVAQAGLCPLRGLSPARGKRFGKMLLVGYDVVAVNASPLDKLQAALDTLPADLAKQYSSEIAETMKAAKGLKSTPVSEPDSEDDE